MVKSLRRSSSLRGLNNSERRSSNISEAAFCGQALSARLATIYCIVTLTTKRLLGEEEEEEKRFLYRVVHVMTPIHTHVLNVFNTSYYVSTN